jgi:hypothetical protein
VTQLDLDAKASAFPGREEAKPAGKDRTLPRARRIGANKLIAGTRLGRSESGVAHTPFADFPTLSSECGCETASTDRAAIREATTLVVEPLEPKKQSAHQVHWVPDAVGFLCAFSTKDRRDIRRIPRRASE